MDGIVEGDDAVSRITEQCAGVTVEPVEHTDRGWHITFQSTKQLWFLFIPLWTVTRKYCLAYQVWPGGAAGIAYAITGGATSRPKRNSATFNISLYTVGEDGSIYERNQLWRVHNFEEAMSRLKRSV